MKILYITDQIYLHGGGERVLTNKSNYLIENGEAEVHIVTSEQKGFEPCYSINPEVILHDLNINYNRAISYFDMNNLIRIPKHYYRLNKLIEKVQPDVIVTLSTQFDFCFLPYMHTNIPKVREFHSSRHYRSLTRNTGQSIWESIKFFVEDYVELGYDLLSILTKDEKQHFKSKNTVVVPNCYTNYPSKISRLENKKVISAGRLAPVKQFEKLIDAWKIVINRFPDWHLDIYGDGEYCYILKLKQQISKLNLNNHIIIHHSTNALEKELQNSSIYVMSSETECFPMVLLEAMSCGLPIVSFDCPNGPRNIVQNNITGLLCQHNCIEDLAANIIVLIVDSSRRVKLGRNARLDVRKFSPKNVMKSWLTIFGLNKEQCDIY